MKDPASNRTTREQLIQRANDIKALQASEPFNRYYQTRMNMQISLLEREILNLKTPDDKVKELRIAHSVLVETLALPDVDLQNIQAELKAMEEESERKQRPQEPTLD